MNAREKAQRLMLVTDIKFRLDNVTGNIVESEQPIDQAVIDEAMNMPKEEYESLLESQRRDNIVEQLRQDYGMQASYEAYVLAGGVGLFDNFARLVVDRVENLKRV